ncbi:hypothetical protein EYF80_003864 [Liparis tanakae]|uniref:Uncharacterized protein n=1 Tax=Liparis tanakae TaxID=230148 RepID=A0A4Z2J7F0_9TELE|nr:hypothetical protein EYF80_003864 [Liparis tanakae]
MAHSFSRSATLLPELTARCWGEKSCLRDLGSNTRRPAGALWCELTLLSTCAISKVPVVSMLAAMMGMPVYVCLELRNRTSLKSSLRSESTRGILAVQNTDDQDEEDEYAEETLLRKAAAAVVVTGPKPQPQNPNLQAASASERRAHAETPHAVTSRRCHEEVGSVGPPESSNAFPFPRQSVTGPSRCGNRSALHVPGSGQSIGAEPEQLWGDAISLWMGAGMLPRCWWLSVSVRFSRLVQVWQHTMWPQGQKAASISSSQQSMQSSASRSFCSRSCSARLCWQLPQSGPSSCWSSRLGERGGEERPSPPPDTRSATPEL